MRGDLASEAMQCGIFEFGDFAVDLAGRMLIDRAGRVVMLRRREFDLLLTFARSPGRVMNRETLLDAIAGREAEAFDRTIDVYVGRLRRKIEADPRQPRLIVTVPGVGYRLAIKPSWRSGGYGPGTGDRKKLAVQAGFGILAAVSQAHADRDPEALASLYAANATIQTVEGLLSGRPALESRFRRTYGYYAPDASTLDQAKPVGDDVMLRAGTWSGIYHGEDGLVAVRGHWTTTDVRVGAAWTIHMETWNLASSQFGSSPACSTMIAR